MELTLVVLGLFLSLLGFAGCLLPILPGPPLSYIALLVLSFARDYQPFSVSFLVITGILTAVVSILDYVIPPLGARRYGASRYGFWGSFIGMLLGLIFFAVLGALVGAWLGAIGGELYAGKSGKGAMRAGWGAFLGNLAALLVKLGFTAYLVLSYVRAALG
ncbi:MAG: DUF456 domain-containing protein [Desulfobacteraceae bacterium]|nr:MAG: DUF456 domain-containing protein [Desulfobacteraceae bacterium]